MEKFFKAVRPDGTDFRTGTVDYAAISGTGEWLPELPGGQCCGPGVYHASTHAADTLIGGSWPCRLFEVEGTPVSEEDNKRGFTTLRVVCELDAVDALGPNGAEVKAVIDRAGRQAVREVRALDAATDAAWGAARGAALDAATDAAWGAARGAAWGAARGAADMSLALVVKDIISAEHFETLTSVWMSVIG